MHAWSSTRYNESARRETEECAGSRARTIKQSLIDGTTLSRGKLRPTLSARKHGALGRGPRREACSRSFAHPCIYEELDGLRNVVGILGNAYF